MFAAIDLGSNSFRLHIGEYVNGSICVIKSAREPNRLAPAEQEERSFRGSVPERARRLATPCGEILDAYPLSDVKVVATNTLRVASNASEFLQDAEKVIGYPIEVISGEEEARLIYLGVANVLARPEERRLVIDIGGGSTELIYGKGQEIVRAGIRSASALSGKALPFSMTALSMKRLSRQPFCQPEASSRMPSIITVPVDGRKCTVHPVRFALRRKFWR